MGVYTIYFTVPVSIFPVELYDYSIISTNNNKRLDHRKISNFIINVIQAERDSFSENNNQKSNRLISNLLEKNLNNDDKSNIHKAYKEFFERIKDAESFKLVFNHLESTQFENFEKYLKTINLVPNFPNLKNIFSNLNLGYGEEFLFQKRAWY